MKKAPRGAFAFFVVLSAVATMGGGSQLAGIHPYEDRIADGGEYIAGVDLAGHLGLAPHLALDPRQAPSSG